MSISMRNPYDAPERPENGRLFINVFLLSLLAHAIILTAVLLITIFMPVPKLAPPEPEATTLTLSPPPRLPAPPQKKTFVPTTPDPNAPHKDQPIESANDHELTTKSQKARNPDSIMPDVEGKDHAPNLVNTPNVQAPPIPQVSSTPPTPKQEKPEKPTPPQPKPQQGPQAQPQPPQPQAKPQPPTPPKKAQPLVDANGFPILPPLNVPTMAPPDSAPPAAVPAPSQQQTAASVHGALGRAGDASPAAMATELGKYKQYVYSVVGSHWYPDINQHFGLIGVGFVHIQFTIHSDGTLSDVTILEGGNLEILKNISRNALVAPAPYKPFSAAMIKQVGDSYTDDFTFSVY